nr:ribonuclease H-like domain-containing protein [Tanacetum cinerariifolium]
EVIVNGDSPPPKRTVDGIEQTYPPITAEEKLARKNELKARCTLLMALLNEHQLKFNSYKNYKSLMEAIEKSSKGLDQTYDGLQKLINQLEILGETISQKDMNLKLLRSLSLEWKTPTLIWRNKPDLETLSMDDLYNNLKIYETEVKGSSSTSQNLQNVAFVSFNSSGSTNQAHETLAPMVLRPLDLTKQKWNAITVIKGGHFARECMAPREKRNRESSDQAEDRPTNFSFMAYTSLGSSSSSSSDSEVSTCSKACLKSYETLKEHYDNLSKDYKKSQLNVRAYKTGLESVEARLVVYKKNEDIFEENIKILKLNIHLRDNALTELRKKLENAEKERDEIKITSEKFENSFKTLNKMLDSQVNDKYKTGVGYHVVPPPYTGNFMPPKPDLILADVDEYVVSESVTSVPAITTNKAETSELKPKSRKPSFVKVEFVKPNEQVKSPRESVKQEEHNRQAKHPRKNSQSPRVVSVNTARQINTAYPRPIVNNARPVLNVFNKEHSHDRIPLNKFTTNKDNNFNEKVNTIRGNITTAGPRARVSDNQGNQGNPQLELQEKEVIDSGCSRHMTGNVSYLSKYEEIDGEYVAFRVDPKGDKITSKGYSTNSKAFKVFNGRTRIVEENMHVKLSENTLNIAGSRPNWLFDIDALTKSLNYKPIVTGNQSNGSAGKARVETVPDKDYILLPLWTLDSLFSFSSKDSPGNRFKPSGEKEKNDTEGPGNEESEAPITKKPRVNQEKDSVNSTNRVNAVSSTVNDASNEVNVIARKSSIELPSDLNMPDLEDIIIFEDSNKDVFGTEADLNNMETTFQVSPIPITRIHKDHPLAQIIRDIHSAPQTRRMKKSVTDH